ncbi:MAG: NeuD/PglB/VioB family sugar acetyltransferase [Bacteroidales bacterium]|nr:NeuD/PglB/VioB family sugar acetyltransferase [Bacteroidales bacterium]
MNKEKIILVGGGGHCKSCIDVIEKEGRFEIEGIVDLPEKVGSSILEYKIIASDDDLEELSKKYSNFLVTVGQIQSPGLRINLFNKLIQLGVTLPVIKSPFAYISKYSRIDKGTIIMHHVIINASAYIGENCIINSKALIEHDAIVGNHCHISTGAIVNGGVKVGSRTFFGSGAVSKQYIEILEDSFVKANSIVR